jgi:hypothetical protein
MNIIKYTKLFLFIFLFVFYNSLNAQSVLKTGSWAKIAISESGMYKISYEDLLSMGFSNIESVKIYGNSPSELNLLNTSDVPKGLQEIPILHFLGNDNLFNTGDYILFYGQSSQSILYSKTDSLIYPKNHYYSSINYYFVTVNQGLAKEVTSVNYNSNIPSKTINTFTSYNIYEQNEVNPLKSGREWYESIYDKTVLFNLQNYVTNSKVRYYIQIAGRDPSQSQIKLSVNSTPLDTFKLYGTSSHNPYAVLKNFSGTLNASSTLSFNIKSLKSGIETKTYLNYIFINYYENLTISNNALKFINTQNIKTNAYSKFSINSENNITVLDVTNPLNPLKITTTKQSNSVEFIYKTDTVQSFIAFNNTFKTPTFIKQIPNQDILSFVDFDMLIICPPEFIIYAQQLSETHSNSDGIRCKIVTQEEIFNEFSSGKPDVSAIRDYIRNLHTNVPSFSYVLLFGDGSYDNRNFDASKNKIITFQSEESLNEYSTFISDDFYGLLDTNEGALSVSQLVGEMDIAVGRFPVNTSAEAEIVTQKTINYISNKSEKGDWQNNLCFIADDADENQLFHMADADVLTKNITKTHPEYNFSKMYLDSYDQVISSAGERYPDANLAINNSVKKGCLVLNYTGHGSPTQMAGEKIIDANSLQEWNNTKKLPLFITASCEIARFDDESYTSLGESLLLEKNGGAIALYSTTRLVFAFSNFVLNNNIYKNLFLTDSLTGKPYTIGKSFIEAKRMSASVDNQNKRNFTLLGDPSITLYIPEYSIIIDSINSKDALSFADTLKAKSINTISGYIVDYKGNIVNDYNGTLYLRVYDKSQKIETLSNDGNDPFSFESFNNELFHGKAQITNGTFKTTLIIPQDIYYYPGTGKISLFATDSIKDAHGAFMNIVINSTEPSTIEDLEGPKIKIYINDSLFRNGNYTHENPKLYIKVFDESGINISNAAIGHNILIVLDNDTENAIILNDFYISDMNTYVSGTIEYPFTNLAEGEHTISITIWDTNNNQTTETFTFYVSNSTNIKINDLYNFPNPFYNHTTFHFNHNQADDIVKGTLFIYNSQGRLIKKIEFNSSESGFINQDLYWDGEADDGNIITQGIYPYTLIIESSDGKETKAYNKMLVIQ